MSLISSPVPWWQTLLITLANVVLSALVQHYAGDVAAGATLATGTAAAHLMPSPLRK